MSPGGFPIQRLGSSGSDQGVGLETRTQSFPHAMTEHFGKFHDEAIDVVGMGGDGIQRVAS